jgi:hypothetical protein
MLQWLQEHHLIVSVLLGLSALMFAGTLVAVPWIVLRLPVDYFSRPAGARWKHANIHPVVRVIYLFLKNAAGLVLVIAGLLMSLPAIPGQGILTVIIGLTLLDFPGKRRLELRIVGLPPVRKTLEWIRERGNKPPLQIPETLR